MSCEHSALLYYGKRMNAECQKRFKESLDSVPLGLTQNRFEIAQQSHSAGLVMVGVFQEPSVLKLATVFNILGI